MSTAVKRKTATRKPPRRAKPHVTAQRRVGSNGVRQPVRHVILPGHMAAQEKYHPRETIAGFLKRTHWARLNNQYGWQFRLPTICVVNGKPVLRKEWRKRRILAADHVEFWSRPWGGGRAGGNTGKQVAGLVALVAIAALSLWTGGLVAGAFGQFAGYATSAAIGLGGGLRVGALR